MIQESTKIPKEYQTNDPYKVIPLLIMDKNWKLIKYIL